MKDKRLRWAILLLLLALGVYWLFPRGKPAPTLEPAIPVVAGTAKEKDVPIYLEGLGTVQALNTVTVHVRVDGQLKEVAFTEGQEVKKGEVLAKIDPDPYIAQLAQAEAKKLSDEAQLIIAEINLQRDVELRAGRVISQQEYDNQKALVAQWKATVAADVAAIESAQVQLNYTIITAPLDGRIGIRIVDPGNIVRAADPNGIILITQLHPITVLFTLPEQNLPDIQDAMERGPVTVHALGRKEGQLLGAGVLKVIDNQIDTTTGTIRMKAEFPNEKNRLWPGQFVNARLLLETRKNGIVVPAQAIQRGPEGTYVFGIRPDMTVEIRLVKVEQIQQREALISHGLKSGERIVVEGQYRLQPHSRVKLADAKAVENAP